MFGSRRKEGGWKMIPMDTPEGRRFAVEMALESSNATLRIEARPACGCGCGRPDRVEFSLEGHTISICDPEAIDAAIETLRECRRQLWVEP